MLKLNIIIAGDYGNNENEEWTILAPTGQSVLLDFSTFKTEATDSVQVFDGCNNNTKRLGSYSGSKLPSFIISSGSSLHITFESDNGTTYEGFSAISYGTTLSSGSCTPSSQCKIGEGLCSNNDQCDGHFGCGYRNCKSFHPIAPETSGCCTGQLTRSIEVVNCIPLFLLACTKGELDCCTTTLPCGVGGGHCSSDDQCSSGLKCGTNYCRYFHPNAPPDSNCCYSEFFSWFIFKNCQLITN